MKNKLGLLSLILIFGLSVHSFVNADSPHETIPDAAAIYLPLITNFIPSPTSTATHAPVPTNTAVHTPVATATQTPNPAVCDPAYPTLCIPSPPPNLNCTDIPYRNFPVLPPDPHGFDGRDNDGWGCET